MLHPYTIHPITPLPQATLYTLPHHTTTPSLQATLHPTPPHPYPRLHYTHTLYTPPHPHSRLHYTPPHHTPTPHTPGYTTPIHYTQTPHHTPTTQATLHVGGRGERLAQCQTATLTTLKPIPVQVTSPRLVAPPIISSNLRCGHTG